MGISGLLPTLKCIQVQKHLREFAGQCIAVDAYVWLHRGVMTCATELATGKSTHKYVDYAMHRVRILRHHQIEPYIVFDGGPLPAKRGTESDRKQRRDDYLTRANALAAQGKHSQARELYAKCVDVTPQMAFQLIKALRAENVQYVVAPYEADAQMAYLERQGLVDAILTEDSDLLVFGCQNVLFKLDTVANTVISISRRDFGSVCRPKSEISLVGWSDAQFRAMAILSGCDYLPSIPGIGLKTACNLLRKWKSPDQVVRAVMLEGKKSVPRGYLDQFRLADRCFQHQRVYCPAREETVYLTEVTGAWDNESEVYVGRTYEPDIAQKIATGDLDPVSLLPMEDINPTFVPRLKASVPTKNRAGADKGKAKATEPPSQGGILSFFGTNPLFPVRESKSSGVLITASSGSIGKSSGKRTLIQLLDDEVSLKKQKRNHISKFFAPPTKCSPSSSTNARPSKRRSVDNKENEYIVIDDDEEADIETCLSTKAQGQIDRGMELEIEEILTNQVVDQEDGYISPVSSSFGDVDDVSSPIRPLRDPPSRRAVASEDRDFGAEAISSPPPEAKHSLQPVSPSTRHHRLRSTGFPPLHPLNGIDNQSGEDGALTSIFSSPDLRNAFQDEPLSDIDGSDEDTAGESGSGERCLSTPASSPPTPITDENDKPDSFPAGCVDWDDPDEAIVADKERRMQAVISGWRTRWSRQTGQATLGHARNLYRRETNITPMGRHTLTHPSSKFKPQA